VWYLPADPAVKLQKASQEEEEVAKLPFRQLIGALSYLAQASRCDIALAVSLVAQHCANYDYTHWQAAIRILRYLKGTRDYGMTYRRTGQPFHTYSDASHQSDVGDRRSMSGTVGILAGAPVTWHACKQRTVSLSSMESEYKALSLAVRDTIWVRSLLQEVEFMPVASPASVIYCDSQAAMAHAISYVERLRTKHVEVVHHFVRERVRDGTFIPKFVRTVDNLADCLTKPLSGTQHRRLIRLLSITATC